MASSSNRSCFQCEDSSSDNISSGWRLRSGEFAQLCHRCASVYEAGRFCETFHSNDDGWRDCESCGKLVHCGCVVSFNAYLLLDFGGVICMECSKINFLMARSRCLSLETQVNIGDTPADVARRIRIEPHYWPRVTGLELQRISRTPKSVVTPLFEKLLTASDADLKLGRIVIPKKCAEMAQKALWGLKSTIAEGLFLMLDQRRENSPLHAFFPDISEPQGLPMKFLDTEGKEWEFYFRFWPNCGSKMYVLEGLRDYMISMKWQAGDIVTFYRMEPEGKMVMGLRKTSTGKPLH